MKRLAPLFIIAFAYVLASGFTGNSNPKVIHVLVALCDNKYQGIVPVPKAIGNGQDPASNLYWGCGYGVKTFFKKQPEWKLVKQLNNPTTSIYERLLFKHKTKNAWLVADAYNGKEIKQTTNDLLNYAAGNNPLCLTEDNNTIECGGKSQLICYVGHDGLMDFKLDQYPEQSNTSKREVVILACASKQYFKEPIKKTGAQPLLWTTHLMCPEAYTLHTILNEWLNGKQPADIRESAAQTYNKYQKCGIKGARNLLVTGF